jgi:hypothetical protein
MNKFLAKIPKPLKISLLVIIIPIAILLIFNKTGVSKKILDILNKELLEENKNLKDNNDEIEKTRSIDSIIYVKQLALKQKEIEQFRIKYNSSLKTIRKYEKAINNYRTGDFNNNFITFSNFITSSDTLHFQ